jgi:hypothetical protein
MAAVRPAFLSTSRFLLPVVLVGCVLVAITQGQGSLPDLAVPADRLPKGCRLVPSSEFEPVVTHPKPGVTVTQMRPSCSLPGCPIDITSNPWQGTDPRTLGWLKQTMESAARSEIPMRLIRPNGPGGSRPVIDAPRSTEEAEAGQPKQQEVWTAELLANAEGLAEGYSAVYRQIDGTDLEIRALRIRSDANPRPTFPQQPNVVAIGPDIVAAVIPSAGPCAAALTAFLKQVHRERAPTRDP